MAKPTNDLNNFHGAKDTQGIERYNEFLSTASKTKFTYTFENFFHPYVGRLIEELNTKSLKGMLDPDFHLSLEKYFFEQTYKLPDSENVETDDVDVVSFPKEIDVREGGPYANYNWELLYHIPMMISVHLSKNQRFAEAQRWFHYIFDPTNNDFTIEPPFRYWKFLRFRKEGDVTQIDELLKLLSKEKIDSKEKKQREQILNGYSKILRKPFQPHAVARTRHLAYQYSVVMKYLDNLIAWGDHLFQQDTIESINEATQRYVLAANILGTKPQQIPRKGTTRPKTFAELKKKGLDEMGNALVELEGKFPFNIDLPQTDTIDSDTAESLFGIGRSLYFCVPRNEKMLHYWDTVADRLFKIRNCMNIEGVVRQLALFDPPIDPGMLVKASAEGIDIGSIVSGLHQPIGPLRSLFLIQKAIELAAEVRGLGSALLSAIEKEEGEQIAMLRQEHEIKIQEMTKEIRYLQWQQTQESTESLLKTRDSVRDRYLHYRRLLGLELPADSASFPSEILSLDRRKLTINNFDEIYAEFVEKYDKTITFEEPVPLDIKKGKFNVLHGEYEGLNVHPRNALLFRTLAGSTEAITAGLANIPGFIVEGAYWGVGGEAKITGGEFFSNIGKALSAVSNINAQLEDLNGQHSTTTSSYVLRTYDWTFQLNQAARELMGIGKQIIGSLISEQVAYHEYEIVKQQFIHSNDIKIKLEEKFTNEELYAWMQGEISRLYFEYYRFAVDNARRAEQTMKRELMRPEVDKRDFIKFNYWDSGRKGLLSGEALYLDCKRLEMAYHENNKREYELTKHISLRQLNPLAQLALKASGSCEVTIPEWLFDMDGPGHFMRRLKNVSLTIPCVTGPFTSVNCTLTLLKSSLRKSSLLKDEAYSRQGNEDDRFVDYYGAVQSIVTSGSNNDSGLFETNLRDERFLPFEGYGVVSTWKLELPAEFRQFDYDTISDIILHIRYTARQGGDLLKKGATDHLSELINEANKSELAVLFSLKQDFSTEWHRFENGNENFLKNITRDHFSYLSQGRNIIINAISLHTIIDERVISIVPEEIDAAALNSVSEALNDKEKMEFELSLIEDDQVLKRKSQANVFVIIKYALEA